MMSGSSRAPNPVIVKLNERWRVADDPLQWILEVRKGRTTSKSKGWRSRSFCTTRTGLRRSIDQLCGPVNLEALALIDALPEHHRIFHKRGFRSV